MAERQRHPAQRNKGGRPKGFRLTQTDFLVIEKIADLGIQSYGQLREGILKDRHRVAVWSRMKRLMRAGLVRECLDDNGRILAWAITRKGASRVFVDPNTAKQVAKLSPVYRSTFNHDRVLVDVREILRKSPVIVHWESDASLRREVMRKFHRLHPVDRREKIIAIPDAILWLKSRGRTAKAALEVELTQKSRARLYKKFETHITSLAYDYIFYVVRDEALKLRLMGIYQDVRENSTRVKIADSINGLYFTTLQNLIELGLHAKLEGIQRTLSFAELSD